MRVRPVPGVGSRERSQGRLPMFAAEPADPLAIVLNRRVRTQPTTLAAPEIVRPTCGEGPDRLLSLVGGALLRGQDLALDLTRLPQVRWRLKPEGPDLGLSDIALARRPRVVDLDDRTPVLDPRAHAEDRTSCQPSQSDNR